VNALVPYKNTELIVETFNKLGQPLTIVGSGPEEKRLKFIAKDNIRFVPFASSEDLAKLYRESKAMVFSAVEDFGMTPVEMQAAGRPVIALGKGGALETVSAKKSCRSGVFFEDLSIESLADTVSDFLSRE